LISLFPLLALVDLSLSSPRTLLPSLSEWEPVSHRFLLWRDSSAPTRAQDDDDDDDDDDAFYLFLQKQKIAYRYIPIWVHPTRDPVIHPPSFCFFSPFCISQLAHALLNSHGCQIWQTSQEGLCVDVNVATAHRIQRIQGHIWACPVMTPS
jgi:hypothetical protein